MVSAGQLTDEARAFFRSDDLPPHLSWFECLSPLHQRLFVVELADAVKQVALTGESRGLRVLLEGWQATAELDAAPEVVREIRRRKRYRPLASFTG